MATEENIWTVKSMLDWTEGYLSRKGDENPRFSAQWLLSEATGLSRVQLYMSFDRVLDSEELDAMRGYVTRRGKGEPLQYITGEVGFRHIMVKVRPGVLIPRPETEVLVSEALSLLPAATRAKASDSLLNEYDGALLIEAGATVEDASALGDEVASRAEGEDLLVADICTGSGCIACSIAYEHPQARVIATDIDDTACLLACDNVAALELADRVEVRQGDLGDALPSELAGSFDLIVSNPPYIPSAVMEGLSREVTEFEPALALDGGDDGLDVYRRLLDVCRVALKSGGAFAFELHETCLDQAANLASQAGFESVRIVADLVGKPRILTARKA